MTDASGTTTFTYDALGRRIRVSGPAGTTQFVLDGANVVADADANGTYLRYYSYYDGVAQLHSMTQADTTYLYQRDLSGNVMGLIRATDGALAAVYDYTAFGVTTPSEPHVGNRFRFASGEQDATGLYYFRSRYYDPALRRWISEDPIGLASGLNPYAYVGNSPINYWDPWGLCPEGYSTYSVSVTDPVYGTVASGQGDCPPSTHSENFLSRTRGMFIRGIGSLMSDGIRGAGSVLGSAWRGARDLAHALITECRSELASAALAVAADAAFVASGGLAATGRLAGVVGKGLGAGARNMGRRGIWGGALSTAPLAVDGGILGAGLMQAGVHWEGYLTLRTGAAGHAVLDGRGSSIRWYDFVPFAATGSAIVKTGLCAAENL